MKNMFGSRENITLETEEAWQQEVCQGIENLLEWILIHASVAYIKITSLV